ncbi:zinc finger CCCH domain-containing protein 13 isoform X2 [Clupea harengus]|uniref:Zinc finger CCCH domain-containing protein 13 isoform X2 n=1 Tax=Clupea harengus TaxID=7950 RepID=A0A6P8GBG1_CLUHA|nr:zinc finger CCCH domain-containing protein 13 isoform X2 [Clupea harengus]
METRRTNLTHADTLRVGERGSRDISPHTGTRRRRENDAGRMTERPPRGREPDTPRGWNRDMDVSFTTFKGREGETEWTERERRREMPKRPNGRVVSMLEPGPVVEREGEMGKGDTFPRMRRPSKDRDRRANVIPEQERRGRDREVERGTDRIQERQGRIESGNGGRETDRDMARKRDKDIQRYREEERLRERERARLIEDWKRNVQRSLDREDRRREEVRECDPSSQERRRERNTEGNDPRGKREMDRERERQRPSDRPFRFYSPQRQRVTGEERRMDSMRGVNRDMRECTREGRRDTRSEGESDGGRGEIRRREENSVTLEHKHSRSEGDNEGDGRRERVRQRQKDRERERGREAEHYRQREGERERQKGRYYGRDRPREREREMESITETQRDEFSETQRRGRDDRGGREREDGRPSSRDDVGPRREGDQLTERHTYSEREREQRRPRERERQREDRGNHSPSRPQVRTQQTAQGSGELISGSDLESERRRRGARDGTEGRESGKESTPERERERRRQREQDFYRPAPVHEENKVPVSEEVATQEEEKRGRGHNEGEREMSKTGAERGEKPETKTMRRMWLVPGSGRARNSRESSQEEELTERKSETERATETASERLEDRYRKLERAGEFVENRGRDGEKEGGFERREGESESESTDEKEANVTEESDREREDGSDSGDRLGSEGLSDRESVGVWRVSPSLEDGFVTVSSGGEDVEEEEEENFEDCKEFWDSGVRDDATSHSYRVPERERGVDGSEERIVKSDKAGTVSCVGGNKLPRKEAIKRAYLDLDNLESVRDNQTEHSNQESINRRSLDLTGDRQPKQQPPLSKNGERVEYEAADATPILQEAERELETQTLSNEHLQEEVTSSDIQTNANSTPEANPLPPMGTDMPGSFEDYGYAVIPDQRQEPEPSSEQPGGEEHEESHQSEEVWTTAEERKRHSQMPHLKWAKNVVREILGASEDRRLEEVSEAQTETPADPNQTSEGTEGLPTPEPLPIYATVQKRPQEQDTDPEPPPPPEEEPVNWEEPREDENDEMRFSWNEVDLRKAVDSIGRTKKRNSKFFNSQLYQQYSEVVLNREILRQSHSDTLSVSDELPAIPASCSSAAPTPSPAQRPLPPLPPVPHPHTLIPSSGSISSGTSTLLVPAPPPRPPSPRVSISAQSQSLWQDLPSVRNSAELEDMNEDQRRLQEVRFEVVTSEASYSRSLDIVVEHFVKNKDLSPLLTTQDRNWLFSRLADVRAISHSFLTKLEERVEKDTLHFGVCDIISKHCQMFRMVYVPYLTNQSYQDKTYQRLMDENPSFKRYVEKLERSPVCQRLPLRSFLILPFQRITRLKLLVQNIVKRTAPKTEEEAQASKAMKLLEKMIQDSNDSITQMKSIESLVSLSAKVDFECKTLPLISQSRRMVREGLVTELMDFSMKETERSIYMHLFNDHLLLSLHKEGGKFTVIDHAPVKELRAENCRVKLHSLQKNVFRLYLSKKSVLLRTDTLSDKLRWISAVSSPHSEIDFTAAQDFPQMQCIRAYMAQQPDELGLEKADVLLVHQQSSDGWVEGTRMSDRHRGWAPVSHLETITNEKARQRNLMDTHKITTATAAL